MSFMETQIRDFVTETFLFGDTTHAVGAEDSLIERGLIDSTGILELVAFVEDEFEFLVEDAEIVPANFDSIQKIAAYVAGKLRLSAVA